MSKISSLSISPESVFTVIPIHNRIKYTMGCLHSLMKQNITGFKVVVVDDGSTDKSAESIQTKYPHVILLHGDGNLWWTGAMNMGVRFALEAGAKYIISLNNDLEVAEDYFEKMIYWAERKPMAILGSYEFDIKTKKPVYAGERIVWKNASAISLLDILPCEQQTGLHKVSHFPGRGLWVPADIFLEIGLFDNRYLPHYLADYDFTLRASAHHYEIYSNLDAVLYNYVDASGDFENKKTYNLRNYLRNLFSIKGGGNLKDFTIIAFRHCPPKYLPFYWLYGMAARMGGYLRDWVLNQGKKKAV